MDEEYARIALHLAESQAVMEHGRGNAHGTFVLNEIVVMLRAGIRSAAQMAAEMRAIDAAYCCARNETPEIDTSDVAPAENTTLPVACTSPYPSAPPAT